MKTSSSRTEGERRREAASPRWLRWLPWGVLALVAACGSAGEATTAGTGGGASQSAASGSSGSGSGSGGSAAGDGLPCDVAALLAARCAGCHASPPVGGAPMPLLSHADLTAPSKSDPSKSYAEVALARMQSASNPMPPKPAAPATAAELSAFQAWLNAGTPEGDCASDAGSNDAGSNPFDVPPQCTSMTMWTKGNHESPLMHPGGACIACHSKDGEEDDAPKFAVAGTVYPTAHEPDDCNATTTMGPAITTAVIEITDKNSQVIELAVNSVGNFYRKTSKGAIVPPFTAKVKYDGRERVMMTPQTSGDCNACHTQSGANNAPGRVLLP